jgi:hypothetical protein
MQGKGAPAKRVPEKDATIGVRKPAAPFGADWLREKSRATMPITDPFDDFNDLFS